MENKYHVLQVMNPHVNYSGYTQWKSEIDSIAKNQGLVPVKESHPSKVNLNPIYLAKGLICAETFRNTTIESGLAKKVPIIISDGKGNLSYL